jgi:hypothetical protein
VARGAGGLRCPAGIHGLDRKPHSRLVALQLLLLAGSAACLVAFGDQADIKHILRGLLITTTIASVDAVLQYVGVIPYAVFLGTDRPIGLYSEPDWLGMFSAVGLIIAFRTTTGRLRTALVFLHLTALLLAAARAAWLAVLVVSLAMSPRNSPETRPGSNPCGEAGVSWRWACSFWPLC